MSQRENQTERQGIFLLLVGDRGKYGNIELREYQSLPAITLCLVSGIMPIWFHLSAMALNTCKVSDHWLFPEPYSNITGPDPLSWSSSKSWNKIIKLISRINSKFKFIRQLSSQPSQNLHIYIWPMKNCNILSSYVKLEKSISVWRPQNWHFSIQNNVQCWSLQILIRHAGGGTV